MKIIISNIRDTIKNDPIIFLILIICIFFSSAVLCFSYGIFINYKTEKQEAEVELDMINTTVQNDFEAGNVLTKSMLREYLITVSDETKDKVLCFSCLIHYDGFDDYFDNSCAYVRFRMEGNEFKVSEVTRDNWEEHGIISSGRYFTDEEEHTGANVALVGVENDWITWNEQTRAVKNSDNTISIWGKEYTVIGTAKSTTAPIVPFESLNDDTVIYEFGIAFKENITRPVYKELTDKAAMTLGDRLIYDDIDIPGGNDRNLLNNLIFISATIAVIAALNFTVPYKYILSKRSGNLAIFRMNGCTVKKAVGLFLAESLLLAAPVFAVSTGCYHLLMKKVLTGIFPYIESAYTPGVYAVITAVYLLVLAVAVIILLYRFINKNIRELMI